MTRVVLRQPAVEVDALRPALEAFDRGTKRSKLRLLSVVCPRGHLLLEVFPTADGPYALWRERQVVETAGEGSTVHAGYGYTVYAQEIGTAQEDLMMAGMLGACRCVKTASIEPEWVREQLSQGVKRVVAPDLDGPSGSDFDWRTGA